MVYFPSSAPWRADLEAELLGFPRARHDDQTDAVAYACLEAGRRFGLADEALDILSGRRSAAV